MVAFIGGFKSQESLSKIFWAGFNQLGFLDELLIADTVDFAIERGVIQESETGLAKEFLSSLTKKK